MQLSTNVLSFARTARLAILTGVLALAACSGGGDAEGGGFLGAGGGTGGGSSTGGGGTGGGGTGTGTGAVTLGAIISGAFSAGEVAIGVGTLSPGGTTTAVVNLVDSGGAPVAEEYTVSFSSDCVADGTASIDSPVTTVNGQATAEYTAEGCAGSDEIRATVTVGADILQAIGVVVVEQDDVGSIEFVSATPEQIAIEGTGGTENSTIVFRVLGATGVPLENIDVAFALNTTVGGLALSTTTATTNAQGEVQTVVAAGSVATSVRVTATITSEGISTQSSRLVVSTGIPDSDSFSISVSQFNPEAFDFDGIEVEVTARAADAFNNPIPVNTSISFYTEGGSIDPSCSTDAAGACSVTWRSQNPRPGNGVTTILAHVIGNESFTDGNGNGRYDDGEVFDDLGEAFADEDEDGGYDDNVEFFVDFNENFDRDAADGMYNGVLCSDTATTCATQTSLTVSDSIIIAMSASTASTDMLYDGGAMVPVGSTIVVGAGKSLSVRLADINENSLPGGTSVTVTLDGDDFDLSGTTSGEVSDTRFPSFLAGQVIVEPDDGATPPLFGSLTVTTETPNNVVTSFTWTLSD